jgi:hypothetical protein
MGIECNEEQMLEEAITNGWLKDGGTALHNIGRNLEKYGLITSRQYKCTINDITNALKTNEYMIAAVDGGELTGDRAYEIMEDITIGEIPDHTVVVLSCNADDKTITIYDPASPNTEETYPIEQFVDAWNDSKNYLVTINTKNMKTYNPKPIDITDVVLTEDLNELREAIAEPLEETLGAICEAMEMTPPELLADVLASEVRVAGGGARLFGFAEWVSQQTRTPCRLVDEPEQVTAIGAAKSVKVLSRLSYDTYDISQFSYHMSDNVV